MSAKILTVDDSKTIRLIIAKAFKPYDCEILEAANGVEGLAAAAKEKPDLIILDLTMPVMDGYETLTKIRSEPDLKAIPVMMLTAEAGKDNVLRIAKLGVRDYIVKPFKEDVLLQKVGKIITLTLRPQAAGKPKNYGDPLEILVVDDKPAIVEQIRGVLSQTPWKVEGVGDTKAALDRCAQTAPDAILVSLSLPNGAAFGFFQSVKANPVTQSVPVLGMSVKIATAEQEQAQKAGFAGIVTKPINPESVHDKLVEALRLAVAERYFQEIDGVMALTTPVELTPANSEDILRDLPGKLAELVDGGMDKAIINLGKTRNVDWKLVKLGLKAISLCKELGLNYCVVGSEEFAKACVEFPEAANLPFVYNWNDAVASIKRKEGDKAA